MENSKIPTPDMLLVFDELPVAHIYSAVGILGRQLIKPGPTSPSEYESSHRPEVSVVIVLIC